MGDWVISVVKSMGYPGITLLMFVENVFPPIPSEVIMPLAGYLASQDTFVIGGVIMAGVIGSVLGALVLYGFGYKLGHDRVCQFATDHGRWLTLSPRDVDRAQAWFERHGKAAVLFCRLIPGIRSLIAIPAGVYRMNLGVFLLFTAIGATLWSSGLALAGYWLGRQWQQIGNYIDPVSWVVVGLIVVWYVYRVATWRGRA